MDREIGYCLCCKERRATIIVDSEIGLMLWNKLNTDDRRSELYYCSISCVYDHGLQLGRRWREAEKR